MNTSVIRHRVADFLKQHAPFDALSNEDLLHLAGSGKVRFHESEEYLFRQGDAQGPFLWIIQQGRVQMLESTVGGESLRDVLGAGDMPGFETLASGASRYAARTATDVILYGIAVPAFEDAMARYPAVQRYLAAHFSLAGNVGFERTSWLEAEAPPLQFLRNRLDVLSSLASVPVSPPTVKAPCSTRDAVAAMLRGGTDHVALTAEDGRLEAILTANDLALFCGFNPAYLVHTMREAGSSAELVPLLRQAARMVQDALAQPEDADDCCEIGAAVMESIAEACIRLAGDDVRNAGIEPSAAPHAWVLFGASARRDLLAPRLPVLAAVYDDSASACTPVDGIYFSALAGQVGEWLHACGLVELNWQWPEGAQPSMPLSEWKRFYSETVRQPLKHAIYQRREFFDVAPLTGDTNIVRSLVDHISCELARTEAALALLANDTAANLPSANLFSVLVLEMDGTHHDTFDIASAVIAPVTDAARVFALAKGRLQPANTVQRLRAALADFPDHVDVLQQAATAFRVALYYRVRSSADRIDPAKLGKFDHLLLKTAFNSVQRFVEFTESTFVPVE